MSKLKLKQLKGGPVNLFFLLGMLLLGIFVLSKLTDAVRGINQRTNYSTFLKAVESDRVKKIEVMGERVEGQYKDSSSFVVTVAPTAEFWKLLKDHNVEVTVIPASSELSIWHLLLLLLLGLIPLAIWYFMRQTRASGGAGNNIFSMSKSKARMFMPSQIKVNFSSVAGAAEAKEELKDVVDFLKNPEKYKKIGAKLTRGVLLVGEPGNGKTLLARAVAGEANCPFFSISGSDFIEVFVGVGAARVRDLFAQARRHAPSIVFIDEIDAVGRQRGSGLGGGHDEREQTLNQLLTEMDGFDTSNTSVVVVAATNRPDVLDKALLRPGRFDRRVNVPYPDIKSREEILQVHAKGVKIDNQVDLKRIARGTPGFTGADLENLINEAAINASKLNKDRAMIEDFEEARDKITLGKENKSIMLSETERKTVAYHEAGHALVILLKPELTDPLHKITIMPRGSALGVTHYLPEGDKYTESKDRMMTNVMICLGGRAAEELVFNQLETGAYSDFVKATELIRRMVCYFGMSKKLGNVVYQQIPGQYEYSEETARMIDHEVRQMMEEAYKDTVKLLSDHRDKLETLAQALLEKETLFAGEVYELLGITSREEHKFTA